MKNRILLLVVLVLLPFAVISFPKKKTNFNLPQNTEKKETYKKAYTISLKEIDGSITKINLEDYVIGVVAGEMPASFEVEALKAQAIAARTYVMQQKAKNNDYDVTTTTADQVYITDDQMKEKWQDGYEKYYNKIKNAVNSTEGKVMKYQNKIIKAYYFAMSNGYTEDAINVFNDQEDYLVSVESAKEATITDNVIKTQEFEKKDFCQILNVDCSKLKISIIEKSATGRINKIKINDKEYSGVQFRKMLNLRSTDFTIIVDYAKVIITTNGYGHGVGMSQYGANVMAKEGSKYEEILKHYYQNITIDQI